MPSSSGVVARLLVVPCLLVWSSPCCLLTPFLSCGRFPSFPPAALLAIRSAISSYRLTPRSFDKWGGANAGCVSVWVRLGCCCLLLAVAVPWMWRGGSSRGCCSCPPCRWRWLLAWFPSSPLLAVGFSIGLACLVRAVSVACFVLVVVVDRHGLIVIGCCRRGFVSSSVAVVRRSACLPSGGVVIRVRPRGGFRR